MKITQITENISEYQNEDKIISCYKCGKKTPILYCLVINEEIDVCPECLEDIGKQISLVLEKEKNY